MKTKLIALLILSISLTSCARREPTVGMLRAVENKYPRCEIKENVLIGNSFTVRSLDGSVLIVSVSISASVGEEYSFYPTQILPPTK